MLTRRGFLGAILATAVAPAIVRADSLMRIVPRGTVLLRVPPVEYAPGYESFASGDIAFGPSDFAAMLGRYLPLKLGMPLEFDGRSMVLTGLQFDRDAARVTSATVQPAAIFYDRKAAPHRYTFSFDAAWPCA